MDRNGLYDHTYEHDACGIGMIADICGKKSHNLVDSALTVLENMKHRGAESADSKTGDGAGIMVQIPHEFILLQGIPVPEKGKYGVGMIFIPKDRKRQEAIVGIIREEIGKAGFSLLSVRDVPVNSSVLGKEAAETEPDIIQVFVIPEKERDYLERDLYLLRKKIENRIDDKDFYIVSLSSGNIIYKGMLSSTQLRGYYPDLSQKYFTSGIAMVHSRFSTNTFPEWKLAQPFRLLAHNGEINTIRGNRAWMEARESVLETPGLGEMSALHPIIQPDMSDSASLDNALEFFVMSGLSLPHAMAMLIPESFNDKNPISNSLKAFYEYHSILMEPWDGPAALLFSDGRYAGGMLDRNGLRPARFVITKSGLVILASEAGTIEIDPTDIQEKGRLQPGKIFMIDTQLGKIMYDNEIKEALAGEYPYSDWLSANRIELDKLKSGRKLDTPVPEYEAKLRLFGYTREDIEKTIMPMGMTGNEPTASMGNDTPLAVLSDRPQLLFNYFRQQFAQVTNPSIDPIREELVMSLTEYIGAVGMNILLPDESHCKMVRLPHPILNNIQIDMLCHIQYKGFRTERLAMSFEADKGSEGLELALKSLCRKAEESVDAGTNYLILSDRTIEKGHAAIPSLLAVSAVHHHLISVHKRVQTAIIAESGEIREVMHAALLLGYGASAICPYMVFAILDDLVINGKMQMNYETAEKNYIKAACKGLYKVMSKMGISTIRSYRGAKIFESVGLGSALLKKYFGTERSAIGGIGAEGIAADYIRFMNDAENVKKSGRKELLPHTGQFSFRKDGERHAWNPDTISTLQIATRRGDYGKFKEFTALADNHSGPIFLRDFFAFKRNPIPISEVEPAENIIKHFVTGAMSFGAISKEAHEALALAMNELGTRSNTGEGGEDSARFTAEEDGISLCSKTKQIASGRFGVTAEYLVNAEELQIKVAQGAKPGEGGQLPGFKVNTIIAKTRHSIPGISLISPPPHHDIYSIEDLAQLIYDLRNVNPAARISVKLVAESGVGTIAAGVVKANADIIVISGAEGGTGASPASSMRYAGIPPEIGLSETQQTLVRNSLRSNVKLQVDGQLKTGKDIVSMALLGADEFAFGTAVLIVLGCVMMRKCHSNTCPVGVATQDPVLRERFRGHYRYVVNYFRFLAEEVREYLASMGFRKFSDIIGRTDLIEVKATEYNSKTMTLDFSRILYRHENGRTLSHTRDAGQELSDVLDRQILKDASDAIEYGKPVSFEYGIVNTDRATGAMLSGRIAAAYGNKGLPENTVKVKFTGSAGQSFGAFLVNGVSFLLEGEANDYLGKGMSGGCISVIPPENAEFTPSVNTIAGNTLLYGATGGEVYIQGCTGERFAVRNSGAIAVVEGTGDHCCEYMTGGRVVVLGKTGRNFAAGMSGGIAYIWDKDRNFDESCNMEMVELSLVDGSASEKELHELIRQHYIHTGSRLASIMLNDWGKYSKEFIQVMPIEYKRVLTEEKMRQLQEKITEIQRDY